MTKCGNKHIDVWNDEYSCSRNKDHHGDHTHTILRPWNSRQKYWQTKHWYNDDRYCGTPLMGNSYRCERKPGHKIWHKSWVFDRYITFKLLNKDAD